MSARTRAKQTLGTVIEIPTRDGLAYAQYSHDHDRYGQLIRVLPGVYDNQPDLAEVVKQRERFFVFFPLDAAIREGIFRVVEQYEVPVTNAPFGAAIDGSLTISPDAPKPRIKTPFSADLFPSYEIY